MNDGYTKAVEEEEGVSATVTAPITEAALASVLEGHKEAYWSAIDNVCKWLMVNEIKPLCDRLNLTFYSSMGAWSFSPRQNYARMNECGEWEYVEGFQRVEDLLSQAIINGHDIGSRCHNYTKEE